MRTKKSERIYRRVAPTIWNGETGKALRKRGSEALTVALYLMTSPHSNHLGLYHQVIPYMGYETALGDEGARKGLAACIDVGFCSYDHDSEMVWVHEMAAWQIADELKRADLRCKGIQKQFDSLPHCPFLAPFFERYASAFHLTKRGDEGEPLQGSLLPNDEAPSIAPGKPVTVAVTVTVPKRKSRPSKPELGLEDWLEAVKAAKEKAIPNTDPIWAYASTVGLPDEFLHLAWAVFKAKYSHPEAKRYRDWRAVFRSAVKENWLKIWWLEGETYALTTSGKQAKLEHGKGNAA